MPKHPKGCKCDEDKINENYKKEKDKIEKAIKELTGFKVGYQKAIEDVEKIIGESKTLSDLYYKFDKLKKENK